MITVTVKPVKRWFTRRQQWAFDIRAANGERIDPRDSYFNRGDVISTMELLFTDRLTSRALDEPNEEIELVVLDAYGDIDECRQLR